MNHTGLRRRFELAVFHVDYSDCAHNEQKSLIISQSLAYWENLIQCSEDKGLIRAKCQRIFKIAIPLQRPQSLFLLQLVNGGFICVSNRQEKLYVLCTTKALLSSLCR